MATVNNLPADQRAVLGLVLQRGRSYDQIATMLSIERSAVQDRALAALDALGPATNLTAAQRAELSDYLLGQLPEQAAEQERFRLAGSDAGQQWARAVAIELASLSGAPLAAIPRPDARPSSRRGGAVLLAFVAVLAVALVVVVLVGGSGSTKKQVAVAPTPAPRTTATGTTAPDIVGQVNLLSPDPAYPSAVGVAQIVRVGNKTGIVIVAQGMPTNPSNEYYAVWLSNTPTDSQLLGFLPQRVTSSGKLEADSVLQPGAARYSKLLVTLESQRKPTQPGTIVLQGTFKLSG
ncbi:MAG: anti-sigma factor domain-containing protein [Solirubrobacteraceae bacterium]